MADIIYVVHLIVAVLGIVGIVLAVRSLVRGTGW